MDAICASCADCMEKHAAVSTSAVYKSSDCLLNWVISRDFFLGGGKHGVGAFIREPIEYSLNMLEKHGPLGGGGTYPGLPP